MGINLPCYITLNETGIYSSVGKVGLFGRRVTETERRKVYLFDCHIPV